MKRAIFTLMAVLFCIGYVSSKELTIKKLTGATLTIDGQGDDWPDAIASFQDLDQHKGAEADKNNTAKFKLTYDNDYIYVYVEVQDATMDTSQSANVWEKDCIEVFFVFNDTIPMDSTESYSNGQLGAYQLRKVWGRDMTDFPDLGVEAAEIDIAGGFAQEWKLPIWDMAATGHFAGEWFRFEMQNGDNDGAGRKSQLFWNSNADNQWNTIKNQGKVILETPLQVSVKTVATASSIRIKSTSIEFAKTVKEVNVYSITGQLMLKARNVNSISTATLKSGVYFVVADNEKAKFVIK